MVMVALAPDDASSPIAFPGEAADVRAGIRELDAGIGARLRQARAAAGVTQRRLAEAHPRWATDIRDQCAATGVAFHYKQTGEWVPLRDPEDGWWPTDSGSLISLTYSGERHAGGYPMQRVGTKRAGRLLDGVTHDAFPEIRL